MSLSDSDGSSTASEKTVDVAGESVFAFPLSFAQQRLWFLDRLEPGSPLYTIPQAMRLQGRLHIEALHQTLDAIVARHETLRTTFTSREGSPIQVIAERRTVDLPVIDLSAWPEGAREAEAERFIREQAQLPFDLARDLMLRATLDIYVPVSNSAPSDTSSRRA